MSDYEMMKQAVREVLYEYDFKSEIVDALVEQKRIIRARQKGVNPDLISTNQAYKLRGEARVDKLISHGLLKRISGGSAKNSPKYVSKKQLFKLDGVML